MALRAVLLDIGDTLLRERQPRHAIYAEAAQQRGVEVSAQQMLGLMRAAHDGLPREIDGHYRYSDPWFRAFIARIFGEQLKIGAGFVPSIQEQLFARFEDPASFELFAGAEALLVELRASGLLVAAVSNWSERLPVLLRRLGLATHFDAILCSATEHCEKPDPRLFRLACERLKVPPKEVLHAGDHPIKDGAAAALGIEIVLVDHDGNTSASELSPAIVRSLPELSAYVRKRLG